MSIYNGGEHRVLFIKKTQFYRNIHDKIPPINLPLTLYYFSIHPTLLYLFHVNKMRMFTSLFSLKKEAREASFFFA